MVVFVIDDDEGMRRSLSFVLSKAGIETRCFSSGSQVLQQWDDETPGCLVVDFLMPDMTGLQLVAEVRSRGLFTPFILVTGHGTVTMAVQAMKMGAVTVVEKPFHHEHLLDLLETVRATIDQTRLKHQLVSEEECVIDRINSLTSRESEIMELVVRGDLTKQIAKQLGISTKTVEVHRSNITKKMGVHSVAQLVKIVISAKMRSN